MNELNNLDIYDSLRVVPDTAKKTINAGRIKGMTDINPMWRIKALTSYFGPVGFGWYYKVTNKWIEQYEQEYAAFVDIELYVKYNGEWSMPIVGTGGSKFATVEKNGPYVSDECYKMATTDAISVACKQLGIGADVYWSANASKYDNPNQAEPSQPTDNRAELLVKFHQEIERTGKSKKWFLDNAKVSDAKFIKTDMLKVYIDTLTKLPTKEVK